MRAVMLISSCHRPSHGLGMHSVMGGVAVQQPCPGLLAEVASGCSTAAAILSTSQEGSETPAPAISLLVASHNTWGLARPCLMAVHGHAASRHATGPAL